MMMTFTHGLMFLTVLAAAATTFAAEDGDRTVDFHEGEWDRSAWTPIRLVEHDQTATFVQRPDSVGNDSFTAEQIAGKFDNILLMTDSGQTAGQIELTFTIGPEHGAAPALFLTPEVEDGVLRSALTVFVADYTMAIWWARADPQTGKTTYTHLVRMNRWSQPGEKHVLRCRVQPHGDRGVNVALQLDDSDVVVLYQRDMPRAFNSRVGIWGCHGTCDFYQIHFLREGNLPWSAKPPTD
jgi:hypothetical protein